MNKEECKTQLKEIIKTCKLQGLIIKIKNKNFDIYSFVELFRIQNNLKSNGESIYWILNDLIENPKCPAISDRCNGENLKFNTVEKGYQKHCIKCCTSTLEYRDKYNKTIMDKYGVSTHQQIPGVKEKTAKTNLNRTGFSYPMQSEATKEKVQSTIHKLFGEKGLSNPIIKEKKIKSNLENYGTEWAVQTEVVQDKRKQTCIENHSVDNWMKTDEARKMFHERNSVANKQEHIDYVKNILENRNVEMLSVYTIATAPILLKCKKCSTEFQMGTWNDFQQGVGICPKC